ncbi:hypothetical protein Ciccas_013775, partial [Cichlidogyrus casuarinus]
MFSLYLKETPTLEIHPESFITCKRNFRSGFGGEYQRNSSTKDDNWAIAGVKPKHRMTQDLSPEPTSLMKKSPSFTTNATIQQPAVSCPSPELPKEILCSPCITWPITSTRIRHAEKRAYRLVSECLHRHLSSISHLHYHDQPPFDFGNEFLISLLATFPANVEMCELEKQLKTALQIDVDSSPVVDEEEKLELDSHSIDIVEHFRAASDPCMPLNEKGTLALNLFTAPTDNGQDRKGISEDSGLNESCELLTVFSPGSHDQDVGPLPANISHEVLLKRLHRAINMRLSHTRVALSGHTSHMDNVYLCKRQ